MVWVFKLQLSSRCVVFIQPQEGVCGTIPTEEVEMEILMEEEPLGEDDEFSSGEEEVEEDEKNELPMEVTSPKMPVENKKESTSSLGFSQELSSILASKMITLNDSNKENVSRGDEITKEKETITKETGKRRKPPPPPTKPKV